MQSLWQDSEADKYRGDLAQRVYTSRLLGRDKSLVLHGGGNTSVKIRERNLVGDTEDILYVKGSGWDLEFIEEAGFSPVRMPHLLRLTQLKELSDPQMVNELVTHLTRASAPAPSVETILHALLPYKYVDHTHSDAVLAVTNTADGARRITEIYGDKVAIIPYVMPGFDLARLCAELFPQQAGQATIGMVLLNHGIFSFGATARESYERMIQLVDMAERYLEKRHAWRLPAPPTGKPQALKSGVIAQLRNDVSRCAGNPMIVATLGDDRALSFACHPDIATISQQGPATPDHVIRTKRLPMVGRNVENYAAEYRAYFAQNATHAKAPKTILDAAPRVVLDPDLGICAIGRTVKDAQIVADLYDHTIDVIQRAALLGGYRALPAHDIFDVEYWDLEQAKLRKAGASPPFVGEIALVTGAASGIGKACVDALHARGAAVVGLDIDDKIESLYQRQDFLGIRCDITSRAGVVGALEAAVRAYGGLDILVLNAGIFPGGAGISSLADAAWREVMSINLDANLMLMRECHPLLKLAPRGGRVTVIGSKNVPAPGPGAAAYSASKAALTQLARVAALEWGADNIRVNTLHPNAVFDTAIWSSEVLAARAAHYGLSIEQYKRNNVLQTEVTSRDVAALAAEMCGPLFAKTTGAQIPIDGGNERHLMAKFHSRFDTLRWRDGRLEMIDQRILPGEIRYLACDSAMTVAEGIRDMVIRGAPAIGCAAAYGIALEALHLRDRSPGEFNAGMNSAFRVLAAARPTAVNLFWALARMRVKWETPGDSTPAQSAQRLLDAAHAIFAADIAANRRMGEYGAELVRDGAAILTHCNAGALATAGHGTALGVIRSAVEAGKKVSVFADETRPFLQGARLTAWELMQDDIPVTLIADNAAGYLMSRGEIDMVIVGADRIAANGDVANKVGTYQVAVLARRHQIPFYVAAPLSTIDAQIATGADIPIEERAAGEVRGYRELLWAPGNVAVRNPVFDVTPAELVTGLITECGVVAAPDAERIAQLLRGA